jgi:hypothetical protein
MAKANLLLPDGTKVTIEGTSDEVSALLARFSTDQGKASGRRAPVSRRRSRSEAGPEGSKPKLEGPTEYIRDLIQEGFFKTKREIGHVRDKLEERAHIYPVTSISGPLYRLVKKRELRRVKEDGQWKYVNR